MDTILLVREKAIIATVIAVLYLFMIADGIIFEQFLLE